MTQQYPPQPPPGGGPRPPQQPPYGQQPQQPYGQQQPPRPPQQPPYGQPAGGPGTPPGGTPGQMPPGTPPGGMPGQMPPGGPGTPPGGMPPQTPGTGMPATPPTPKKSKARPIIIVVVALVVIGVIGFIAWQNGKTAPSSANPGDCIKVNSQSASDADVEKIDCNSQEAVYKVGVKLDSASAKCPTDSYNQYMQSGKGDDFSLCLMLNAKDGECFANLTTTDPDKRTTKVACTAPDAEGKVSKVVNGKAAESACPEDTGLALIYPQPAPGETVCLVKAGETSGA